VVAAALRLLGLCLEFVQQHHGSQTTAIPELGGHHKVVLKLGSASGAAI
jgi:hypothetical protein